MEEGGGTLPEREDNRDSGVVKRLVQREGFLERLAEGRADKPELIETLGVSRSTVDRVTKELQLEGLIERRPEGYGITLYGRLALQLYRRFSRSIGAVHRSRDALRSLPPSTDLDPLFFRNGKIVSDDGETKRPSAFIRELLEDAETFWTVTKSPHFELISLAHRRVVEEGMKFELIHSTDSIERLNLHYPEIVESALQSGNLEMYSLDAVPPFGLIKAVQSERRIVVLTP